MPIRLPLLSARDEDVLRFYVTVHDLEGVQVPHARSNLPQGTLGIEGNSDFAEMVRAVDDVRERGRTQLESDVKETFVRLLVVIPNDVWMVVRVFEKADFAVSEGDKVPKEAFDGYCAALQRALVNDSAM